MKTVHEAVIATQKKKAGLINRASVKYAETLLLPNEDVRAAVIANIKTKKDSFPGVVVITDQRVLAVCGLPGIKRCTALNIEDLTSCEETATVISYKAIIQTRKDAFSMSVDPDVGDEFTKFISELNGEEFEAVKLKVDGHVFNPNMVARRKRTANNKEKAKERNIKQNVDLQKRAAAMFDEEDE